MTKKTEKTKKKNNLHICSGCIEEFKATELFLAMVKGKSHQTIYCKKCLDERGITKYTCFQKPRKNAKKS
jgi:sulfur relay (sulfurtransferase) complex TusBCD TusD component (DsrE family)